MRTNKLQFFKLLEKASQPLKTSRKAKKFHGLNNGKKTHPDKTASALEKQREKCH